MTFPSFSVPTNNKIWRTNLWSTLKFQMLSLRHRNDVSRATKGIRNVTVVSEPIIVSKVIVESVIWGHCCKNMFQQWPQFTSFQIGASNDVDSLCCWKMRQRDMDGLIRCFCHRLEREEYACLIVWTQRLCWLLSPECCQRHLEKCS